MSALQQRNADSSRGRTQAVWLPTRCGFPPALGGRPRSRRNRSGLQRLSSRGRAPAPGTRRQSPEPSASVPRSKPHRACRQLALGHLLGCCSHLCIKFMGKFSLFKSFLNVTLAYCRFSVVHRHVFYKKSFHFIMYL